MSWIGTETIETTEDRLGAILAAMKRLSGKDPHCRWFVHALEAVLDGRQASLDQALGLKPGPGQRSLKTRCQLQERDALYRRAWRRFYADLKPAPAARELHRVFRRYEASAWIRDRGGSVNCPERLIGKPQALAWETLSRENPTLSADRIRKILVTS